MRTLVKKENRPQQHASFNYKRSSVAAPAVTLQAVHRSPGSNTEELELRPDPTITTRLAHDLSHIPIYRDAAAKPQPELRVNAAGDTYELEADRAADYVTDMAAPSAGSNGEEKGQVRQTAGHTQPSAAGETVAPFTADEAKLSSGQKLDPATRSFFEPRFGHDFSRVRVHADGDSARLSESLNAHAFTYGSNIYFNRAQYNPASPEGKHLLAHELAHVVQQSGGAGLVQRQPKRQPKTTKPVRSGDRRDISEFLTSMSRRVNVLLGLELQDDFGSLEKEVLKHATSKERVITEELFDEPKIELPPLTIAFIRGLGEVTATGVPFDELIDLSARITALNAATAVEPSFKETERRILEELARPRGRRIDSEL